MDVLDPHDISFDLLQRSAGPLLTGDFEAFAACFHLPHALTTPVGLRIIRTREDLRAMFDEITQFYGGKSTQTVTRKLLKADYTSDTTAVCIHENHLIGSKGLVTAPVRVFSIMHRRPRGWAVSYCEYTPGECLDFCRALVGDKANPFEPDATFPKRLGDLMFMQ